MTKAEEIIRNLEQTINKKTTEAIMRRYDDIQILGNERGLTDNSKVFLANIEAIHLVELDRRGERVEEEMPSGVEATLISKEISKGADKTPPAGRQRRTAKQIEEAKRMVGEDRPPDPPKRGRPKGSKNKSKK